MAREAMDERMAGRRGVSVLRRGRAVSVGAMSAGPQKGASLSFEVAALSLLLLARSPSDPLVHQLTLGLTRS